MNDFEKSLIKFFSIEKLKKIQNVSIGIAGLGGLGSNIAFNLVRSGFRKFVLVDFDIVSFSNLNRQFYFYNQVGLFKTLALKKNLLQINDNLIITTYNERIDENNIKNLFKNCDSIAEAFDDVSSKTMLIEQFADSSKFIVSASGVAGFDTNFKTEIKKVKENIYLVGDMKSEVSEKNLCFSPKINIVAAKQSELILKHFLNFCT